jgi:type II secretory pathway component PulF
MKHPSKFSPVLIGTAIMSLIAIIPFLNFINLVCCAGIVIGGASGAMFYNNQLKQIGEHIQYKDGAAIGVLSGFLAAIIVVVFTTLLSMAMNHNPIPEVYKVFDQQGLSLPPKAEKFLKQISDEYNRNGFSISLTLVTLVMDIIIYPIMGAVGGMLAVIVVGKKKDAAQQ